MDSTVETVLKAKMDDTSFAKLAAIENDEVFAFVAEAAELCDPDRMVVCDDSAEDIAWIRQQAIDNGEEKPLAIEGHTAHFDGYYDQARKKEVTKYLVPADEELDPKLNQVDREEGLAEMNALQEGAYRGRTAYVRFFCLGPTGSVFAIPCLQITDSAYVAHSEDLLYRNGYEEFKRQPKNVEFFRFRHATGEVDERMTSMHPDKNRVYMDHTRNTVYSVNTQYAGNTVGLKKLSLRLAIRKADREGWLAEHMFIMRSNGPGGRKTYFCGAFPSACGKTSTAMIPGENVVGDDLAYFRVIDGAFRAVNVESGIFGIIRDVNSQDDPVIWDVLHKPGEVIFGNVLVKDGTPYWLGMGEDIPSEGENYCGQWHEGMMGPDGAETTPSHRNARYTIRIDDLANKDPDWDRPDGHAVSGLIYGGRDSDTSVPVREAFGWEHGICTMGAMLESETTAATIGQEGVRKWNVMSNMDFLSMSVGKYLKNNLEFARDVPRPLIFGTNYFLKNADGKYLNGMRDKSVWIKWMELRANDDAAGITAPTGIIPRYEDLRQLFRETLDKEYTEDDYVEQFTIRIPEWLAKLDRMAEIYDTVDDKPQAMVDQMAAQRERLEALRAEKGDYVSPLDL